MCFKKLKGKISQSIIACKLRSIGRLTKQKLQSVQVPIFLTIIAIFLAICLLIKFLPNKIEFLDIEFLDINGEGKSNLMSFIELIIEGIFCILVWKEFKMTRKSFEWQQTEQQEKRDKEANRQLLEIIKFFTGPWIEFLLLNKTEFENIKKISNLFSPDEYNKKIKELILPEEDKKIKYMFSRIDFYTTKEEKNMIIHILQKFVINNNLEGIIKKYKEEKTDSEIFNKYIDSIKIKPEEAKKHFKDDYRTLEKIYNNILYGYDK